MKKVKYLLSHFFNQSRQDTFIQDENIEFNNE